MVWMRFTAKIGAEALEDILSSMDLTEELVKARQGLGRNKFRSQTQKIAKTH